MEESLNNKSLQEIQKDSEFNCYINNRKLHFDCRNMELDLCAQFLEKNT